jgi:hypothetical protein
MSHDTPMGADATEKQDATRDTVIVPTTCLLAHAIEMSATHGETSPTNPRKTRTALMIAHWTESAHRSHVAILASVRGARWVDVPYFLVPAAHLTGMQYARFLYAIINVFYNPVRQFTYNDDPDNHDKSDEALTKRIIPGSIDDLRKALVWFHARQPKLRQLAQSFLPEATDLTSGTALLGAIQIAAQRANARFKLYMNQAICVFLIEECGAKIVKPDDFARACSRHSVALRAFHHKAFSAYIAGDVAKIKELGKKLGEPSIAMYLTIIDFQQTVEYERDRLEREHGAAAARTASAAAATPSAAPAPSASPVPATPTSDPHGGMQPAVQRCAKEHTSLYFQCADFSMQALRVNTAIIVR